METPTGANDPKEMEFFGFDPTKPEDREAWEYTTPSRGNPAVGCDYSKDAYEFGDTNDVDIVDNRGKL